MNYIAAAIFALFVIIVIVVSLKPRDDSNAVPEHERVGRQGEETVRKAMEGILRDKDRLLTNVEIEYEDRRAELDCVVVNQYGVFIIEVKNYKGRLVGGEEDYEWEKYKTTEAGNTYEKTVKNPIRQVRREVYLLASYFRHFGVDAWVEGYTILLYDNSPVDSKYVLHGVADIDRAIHSSRNRLDAKSIDKITGLLT